MGHGLFDDPPPPPSQLKRSKGERRVGELITWLMVSPLSLRQCNNNGDLWQSEDHGFVSESSVKMDKPKNHEFGSWIQIRPTLSLISPTSPTVLHPSSKLFLIFFFFFLFFSFFFLFLYIYSRIWTWLLALVPCNRGLLVIGP